MKTPIPFWLDDKFKKEWQQRYAAVFCAKGVQWQVADYCSGFAFREWGDKLSPEEAAERYYEENIKL